MMISKISNLEAKGVKKVQLILVSLSLVMITTISAFSQSIGTSGSLCVGSDIVFYLQGNCSGTTWGATNGTVSPGTTENSVHITFNSAGQQTVTATSSCNGQTNSYYSYPNISAVVAPAVALSVSPANKCAGSSITLAATPTNGGSSPTYNFYIDGTSVYSGTSSSYSTSSLGAGAHSAYVIMNSSLICVSPNSATSSTANFTITSKSSYTVTVNGPSTICSTSPSAGMSANVTGAVGNLTYQWYKNGVAYGSASSLNYTTISPVSNGDQLTCSVSSDYWCVNSPTSSNTYTVAITNSVTPSVGVQVSPLTYCSGSAINFSASGTNISGTPTYTWQLNGNQIQSSTSSSVSVNSNYVNTSGQYSNGSTVTVNVTSISGTCLTSTSASGNAPALTINAPTVAGALSASASSICNNGSLTLSVTGNTGSITRYMVRSQDDGGSWSAWTSTTANPSVSTNSGINRTYNFQAFVQNGACAELGTNIVSTTVSSPVSYTVNVAGPSLICSSSPTGSFYANPSTTYGTLTYQWYLNGSPVGTNSNIYNASSLSQGNTVYCNVSSNYWCIGSQPVQSNTYTVNITNSVTPTAGINVLTQYCSGQTMNLSVNSNYANGSSTYVWKLNGNQFSTSSTTSLPTSTTYAANTFYPGSTVTVDVGGLAGTCLTTTSASASTSGTSITIYSPTVAGTLSGLGSSYCNNANPTLTVTNNTGSVTRYMYQYSDNGGAWSAWAATTSTPSLSTSSGINRTYQIQAFVQNGGPCAEVGTNILSTTLYYSNVMGTLSSSQSLICAASGSTNLALTSLTTNNAQWQSRYSDDGGSTYTGWNTFSSVLNTSQSFTLTGTTVGRTYQFQVTANNGACLPATSNTSSSTINPIPVLTVTPTSQTIYSQQQTSIGVSSTVTGTSYSYTIGTPTNVSNASSGSTVPIQQTLSATNGTTGGNVVYTITPTAAGCTGSSATATVSVFPVPVITASSTRMVSGPVMLTTFPIYNSYSWKNSAGAEVGTSSAITVAIPGNYTVTATVNSVSSTSGQNQVLAQYAGQNANYVVSYTALVDGISSTTSMDGFPPESVAQTVQYFDGLGRLTQTVAAKGSPLKADVVQPSVYDGFGREYRKYLPFTYGNPNSGWLNSGAIDSNGNYAGTALNYYNNPNDKIADDTRYFSETFFEPSPQNRPLKDYGPGAGWFNTTVTPAIDKPVQHNYLVNVDGTATGQEKIIFWTLDTYSLPIRSLATTSSVSGGCYTSNQLNIKSTIDEQGHEVREYVNRDGQTVLKKVQAVDNPVLNDPTHWTQTYYIYDDFGLLRYVLQPELVKTLVQNSTSPSQFDLNDFAFQYMYDSRQRLVQKQVPGAGAVYMVYDNRDRLVMTQDANQRPNNQWLLTKYDVLNRPVITALYTHTSTVDQNTMSGLIDQVNFYETYNGASATHGYTSSVWPTSGYTVLTAAYYDSYNFVTDLALGSAYNFVSSDITGQQTVNDTRTRSNPTGAKVNVLNSTNYLYSVTYYDSRFRPMQTIAQNNKGGWDRVTNLFDFPGRVTNTKTTHHTSTHADQTVAYRFTYDHGSRKIKTYLALNNEPNEQLVSQNNYNELGQLVEKNLHLLYDALDGQSGILTADDINIVATAYHGETNLIARNSIKIEPNYVVTAGSTPYRAGLTTVTAAEAEANGRYFQSMDYRYNIRGWLTSMNNSQLTNDGTTNDDANDLFGMNLGYNTSVGTGNSALYNGNISAMKWSTNLALGAVKDVAYNYSYDPLNRIKAASYLRDTLGVWGNAKGQFSESGYQYDMNGNIKNLVRNGSTGSAMDNLTYSYTGNQLQSVAEGNGGDPTKGFIDGNLSGSDYHYDANGNMDHDFNKKIGTSATDNAHIITYNHLNLPVQVIKNTNEKIIYTYDAGGRKLKQDVYNASNAITKTTDYDGAFIYQGDTLQFINHEEGRIVMKNVSAPEYQYHLKDHLGNVRVTFTTEPTVKKFTAGFETANQTTEASPFGASYPDASHINTVAINAHSGSNSLYLNGSANGGQVAMAKSLSVMPGDVVSIQAYAKYYAATGTQSNLSGFATALVNAFGMTAPIGGETGTARSALYTWGGGEAGAYGDGSNDHDDPRVFVTILMFDRNFVFQDVTFQQLTSSGVMNASYTAKQPGYAYIYVSNEEANLRDVYFDDVTITQTQSPVVQQEDFYPFGLSFNEYLRENSVPNRFKYNKKEFQDDLGFNMYDYGARFYDPAIARFPSVDPHTEKYTDWTPYLYAGNDPIRYEDKNGEGPGDKVLGFLAAVADNVFGGVTPLRDKAAEHINQESEGDVEDFNEGQNMGDVFSLFAGMMESETGAGLATAGVVGAGPTAGASLTATAVGSGMTAHGVVVSAGGARNLITQKGRLEATEYNKTKHTDNRHVDRTKYPEKSKYSKPNQVNKLNEKTMKKPDKTTKQGNGRVVYERDMKRKIGTKGQTTNKVVVDPKKKKIVTSYPTK